MAARFVATRTAPFELSPVPAGESKQMVLIYGDEVDTTAPAVDGRVPVRFRGRTGTMKAAALMGDHPLECYFLDVGQGDATLIVTPGGKKILVDGGKSAGHGRMSEAELTHLRTEVTATSSFSLDGGGEPLTAITGDGTGRKVEPTMEALSTIVDLLNERFGTNLSDADKLLFDQFEEDWVADPDLEAQAQSNDLANFGFGFDKKFEATIIGRMDINDEIFRRLMDDATFAEAVRNYYRERVYERLREDAPS